MDGESTRLTVTRGAVMRCNGVGCAIRIVATTDLARFAMMEA